MFKSSDVAYWKPSNFNNISLVLGIGYYQRFNWLFRFLKSLRKLTWFDLYLGCAKDGVPHYKSFALSSTTIRTKRSNCFLSFLDGTFGIGYGLRHIGLHPFLIRSLLNLFPWWQVLHQTTLRIFIIILAIHNFLFLSDSGLDFS